MIDIYSRQPITNWLIVIFAALIGLGSIIYTNSLVNELLAREEQQTAIFARVQEFIAKAESDENVNPLIEILQTNYTIPVILTDEEGNIISYKNVRIPRNRDEQEFLRKEVKLMQAEHEPIQLQLGQGFSNYIYYKNSELVTQLRYFPIVQLSVIFLFFIFVYVLFSASRRAEQNKVWVGLAKETAHQLGTPLSALMAWTEYLKTDEGVDPDITAELEKDVQRLDMITARFSSIGSPPAMKEEALVQVVNEAMQYLQKRISSKVHVAIEANCPPSMLIPLNRPLFEWVIENLCKNAVDAMGGIGSLHILLDISKDEHWAIIDISDTGKGIPKTNWKRIFQPGFTTKKRGWGLGLTLARRIVAEYHKGKIFILRSEPDRGSTFRIMLPAH
jgi:signal transduction histidine kinase